MSVGMFHGCVKAKINNNKVLRVKRDQGKKEKQKKVIDDLRDLTKIKFSFLGFNYFPNSCKNIMTHYMFLL